MKKKIAVIKGDGIGPEIVTQAIRVLDVIVEKYNHTFNYEYVNMGGIAIDEEGEPLPAKTLTTCQQADAVLLGAVGGPKWESLPGNKRPEVGLLGLRKGLGLYANLRPAKLFEALKNDSPLKESIIQKGIDFLVVRELIGGVYFGEHKTEEQSGQKVATDVMSYSEQEINRILQTAFKAAQGRSKKITSVDKANVLDTSRLWRACAEKISAEYEELHFENMLVDNAAMQMVKDPAQFDVIVTENMFGDILSDEASMITGSIGLIPSASLGEGSMGLYEPIHGSAPDIAGQDKANPIGTILSTAMLLRYSFGLEAEAQNIEQAVDTVLNAGVRSADIAKKGDKIVGCEEMGRAIIKAI